MADPAVPDTIPDDWTTPGFLADATPQALPAVKATPAMTLRPPDQTPADSFDPDAALAHINDISTAVSTAQKLAPAAMQTFGAMGQWQDVQKNIKMADFDPDEALAHINDIGSVRRDFQEPAEFSKDANLGDGTEANAKILAGDQPDAGGPHLDYVTNLSRSIGNTLIGTGASMATLASDLISRDIPPDKVDDPQWASSRLMSAVLGDLGKAGKAYAAGDPTDPTKPVENIVGNTIGGIAPAVGTGPLGFTGVVAGGGAQGYAEAKDRGASDNAALAAGAADAAITGVAGKVAGVFGEQWMPATAPAASASWNDLFSTAAKTIPLNYLKSAADFFGQGELQGQVGNLAASPDQQQTQTAILRESLSNALVGGAAGVAHGVNEQAGAEKAASDAAASLGMDKASFITDNALFFNDLAANSTMDPAAKLAAAKEYLGRYSPDVQRTIIAHVANVNNALAKIQDAADTAAKLSSTNPQTAEALKQEQTQAALSSMGDTALTIEQQADEAEKKANEAIPETKPPEPETAPTPVETKEPSGETQESPISGGMASDEYDALAKSLENSTDPDIQAQARRLLIMRQMALQEHAATDSLGKKAELEQEIQDHEEALRNLAEEPVREAPAVTPPVTAKIEPMSLAYDEYGKAIHVEPSPPAEEEKPQAQTTPEPAPVAPAEPEHPETPESAPAVAEERPAEIPPHVDQALTDAEQKLAAGDHDGAEAALNKAYEGFTDDDKTNQAIKDRALKISKALDEARTAPPDVAKMKRADLEKVAADEGHDATTIKAAKGVKGLRDIIEAKREAQRVMATPVTNKGALVKDGKAFVDPKIKSLPKEYKDAVQAFIDAATKMGKGTRGVKNFVLDTHENGSSRIFVNPRSGDFETVYIDPVKLVDDIRFLKNSGYDPKAMAYHLRTVFNEEWIHNQAGVILHKNWTAAGAKGAFEKYYGDNYAAIHARMTPEEIVQTKEEYGPNLAHPENIGEEFFRKTIQKALGQETTEAVIAKIRKQMKLNPPMRTLFQSLVDRFNGVLAKLGHDPEVTLIAQKLGDVLGKKAIKVKSVEEPAEKAGSAKVEPDEDAAWLDDESGTHAAAEDFRSTKTPDELDKYHPFLREGEEPQELKPSGEEKLRAERTVPTVGEEREQRLSRQAESLKDVEVPQQRQEDYALMVDKLATMHFGENAKNRDMAAADAKVKVLTEAKKWQEKNGSLDGFGARRVIQNALLDAGRRLGRGEARAGVPAEKPLENDNPDYEVEQQKFETVGDEAQPVVTTETPAMRAQNAVVEKNLNDITNKFSPYGKRLLEIWADTPPDARAAFPPWANKAAKEFGVPRAKILADMDAIHHQVAAEVAARGLTSEDFQRSTSAPNLRPEAFAERANQDERLKEDVRNMIGTRMYEQKANQLTNDEANQNLATKGDEAAYADVMQKLLTGRPDRVDIATGMKLALKLGASENGGDRLRGAELGTALSSAGRMFGQTIQAFRMWSKLGADGVLAAYDKIMRPVIEAAKEPFKATTGAIEGELQNGRVDALEATIKRLQGLLDRGDAEGEKSKSGGGGGGGGKGGNRKQQTAIPDDPDRDIWHSYMQDTAEALSKLNLGPVPAKVKGAFEEFNARLKSNLSKLLNEDAANPAKKIPRAILTPDAKLSEIYRNEPEYKEAWDYARAHIEAKYADDPDTLKQFEGALDKAFKAPAKLQDQALLHEFKLRGTTLRRAVNEASDASTLKAGIIHDVANRVSSDPAQREQIEKELGPRFDALHKDAVEQNQLADEQKARIQKAKQTALTEGMPLWQRYVNGISESLAKVVDGVKAPEIKPVMQEFASRVSATLKSLVNETQVDSAMAKPGLSPEQKLGEIYRNLPAYKQAWDSARNAMRDKIGDDPEKLKQFDAALNKAFEAPAKLTDKVLNSAMKASGIKIADVAREWAGSQERTKQKLIDDLKSRIGLTGDQAKALGDAVSSRFNERLQAAKKAELVKLLRQSGQNRLANDAPALADKIFKAINLGLADNEAVWNAVADKYKLPKYDPAVAADLKVQADKIQRLMGDGPGGKITDDLTQDMMNKLADEAQKNMSWYKQIGQGEMAVFYGNIFGPSTVGRKSISEVLNLVSEVGTMAAADMRNGDAFAIPRAYAAALRGLYQRGGADFRSILATGRGMRQMSGDYTANNLVERGKIFGNVPVLSKLNAPLSAIYKPVGRILYGAQAFFYAGSAEARANMVAYRLAKADVAAGRVPDEVSINQRTQEILGNSSALQAGYAKQAADEGLTGRAATLRARELAEQQRPEEVQQAAHDFATRATFMQEPEGVLGVLYRQITGATRQLPPLRLLVPVTRVMSNVFNNFLSYTPAGIGLPKFGAFDGSGAIKLAQEGRHDEMYQQIAKMTAGALGTIAMATYFGSNIQGAGPQAYDKKKQMLDQGWIPYSVKIGNKYVSYREWPTALMMAGLGSYFDQAKYGNVPSSDLTSRLALATLATGKFAFTSSWVAGLNNLMNAFNSESHENTEKALMNLAGQTIGALVPFNQSTVKMVDKLFDPSSYPPKTVAAALTSQIAFVRRLNDPGAPALNALGDRIETNPIQAFYSTANPDPVWKALSDKEVFIPAASKLEKINGRSITNDELYSLVHDAGQATKSQLQDAGIDAMNGMDRDQAQAYLDRIYHENVTRAKAELSAQAEDAGQGRTVQHHGR